MALTKKNQKYNAAQKKCLSFVWSMLMLGLYLYATNFTLLTYHDA